MCFIYVVDDDPIHQKITEILIRKTGLFQKHAGFLGVNEAIQSLLINKDNNELLPDIILLDLNMPVLDGWDFLNTYEKIESDLSKNIRIYIVTSSTNPSEMDRSKKYKCVKEFVTKPLDVKKVNELYNSL